jgi:hypothetical protein
MHSFEKVSLRFRSGSDENLHSHIQYMLFRGISMSQSAISFENDGVSKFLLRGRTSHGNRYV